MMTRQTFLGLFVTFFSLFVALYSSRVHAEISAADFEHGFRDDAKVFYVMNHIIRIGIFAFLSAVFAGLTLGVMCADTFTLEIIAESGPMPICTYAATILPLRKQGHKTLCTLIISNMLCNVLIVQEFNKMFDASAAGGINTDTMEDPKGGAGIWKFVVSTLFIVFFTELIPMSICKSKHSLRVAAAGSVFVRVAMLVTYPIAAPLGKILDVIVGATENGQIYDKQELRRLMIIHYERETDVSKMPQTELKLLLAAMDFQESRVADIMTPLDRVTMVEEHELITADFVERVWMSGRSRIPVLSKDKKVRNILMSKDLMGFRRFSENTTVLDVVQSKRRVFAVVGEKTTLPAMLKFFQDTKIHMAVVFAEDDGEEGTAGATAEELAAGDAQKRIQERAGRRDVGLITLEDVVEKMLNDQIYDEYDRYDPVAAVGTDKFSPVHSSPPALTRSTSTMFAYQLGPEPEKPPRVNFYSYFTHPEANVPLTDAQVWGAAYYLSRAVKAFAMWSPATIHYLLSECKDQQFNPVVRKPSQISGSIDNASSEGGFLDDTKGCDTCSGEKHMALRTNIGHENLREEIDEQYILYKRGIPSEYFTLVLGGQIDLLVGCDCFHSTLRSFEFMGEDALFLPFYIPDCTAVVQRPARVYRIHKNAYERIFNAITDQAEQSANTRYISNGSSGKPSSYYSGVSAPKRGSPSGGAGRRTLTSESDGLLAPQPNSTGSYGTLEGFDRSLV